MLTKNFRIKTATKIANGKVNSSAVVRVEGINELSIILFGGAENGLLDNAKLRFEVPIELNIPIPPGPETFGLPLVLQQKYKFLVETAFSAPNSTLSAGGRYRLSGPIGYEGGAVQVPAFEGVDDSILTSIRGVSIGVSGVVMAIEFRFLIGLGTPAAMAGPYAKLVASVGVTRGSDLGSALAVCKSATLKMDGGGGVGVQMSQAAMKEVTGILAKLLNKDVKLEFEPLEQMATIWNATVVVPNIPLCNGNAALPTDARTETLRAAFMPALEPRARAVVSPRVQR